MAQLVVAFLLNSGLNTKKLNCLLSQEFSRTHELGDVAKDPEVFSLALHAASVCVICPSGLHSIEVFNFVALSVFGVLKTPSISPNVKIFKKIFLYLMF